VAQAITSHHSDASGRPGPGRAGADARELDLLQLLAQGLTNPDIAQQLVLSEHTAHRHLANILRKLSLPTRAAAAAQLGEVRDAIQYLQQRHARGKVVIDLGP
jgi:DNA-binding NarL/FixJ family response regulator